MSTSSLSYQNSSGLLNQLNPSTKLYFMIWFVMLSLLASEPLFIAALFVLLVFVVAISSCAMKVTKLSVSILTPIFLFLSVVHGLVNPANSEVLFSFTVFGYVLDVGREGIVITLNLVSKLALILPIVFVFVFTTKQEELMPNLIHKGVPPTVSYLFLASINVIPQIKQKMEVIRLAQETRGIKMDGSFITRVKAFIPILMPVILSSLSDIHSRSITLEIRSFGVSRKTTSLYDLEESKVDKLIQRLLIMSFLLFICVKVAVSIGG